MYVFIYKTQENAVNQAREGDYLNRQIYTISGAIQ